MRRILPAALIAVAMLSAAGVADAAPGPAVDGHQGSTHARRTTLPPKKVWLAKVRTKVAKADAVIDNALAAAPKGEKPALVLDIDNTSIQTHYAWPKPVKPVRKVARYAARHGVTLFFVTGRAQHGLKQVEPVLTAAGYRYQGICGRKAGEGLTAGKQRCRAGIAAQGYTVILDIGNRATDLRGANVGTPIKLPSYYGLLS
jgi:predicted secreted acid phosphatase